MMSADSTRPQSLWVRLVFFFVLIAAATLLFFLLIFNYSFERHLQDYFREREETLNHQIATALEEYYAASGDWTGIRMPLFHIAMSTGTRLLLADEQGTLIFDSGQGRRRHMMMTPVESVDLSQIEAYRYQLEYENRQIGELIIAHPAIGISSAWRHQDLVFRRAIGRSLLWTGLIAFGVALILGILFSRRLSRPLEEVAGAAIQISRGDYSRQLPAYGNREFDDLAKSFNQMAGNLQELEKLRMRSVADLSHELRTPLTTLRSYVEAVREGVLPADEKNMGILLEEILHLNRVIADLDELAWAEGSGRSRQNREEIDLNRLLADKAASFKPLLQGKKIDLSIKLPAESLTVFQDPANLGKIIGNLLENAYRYTEPGGAVRIALQKNPVIDAEAILPLGQENIAGKEAQKRLEKMVMITVSDNGIGIKAEHLPYIFERFFRADYSRERASNRTGSGIGLALVKELTRAAGGMIMVSSEEGKGTTFYLYLPAKGSVK
ncbi:MAG TPA: HAMP domain-containing sensor histidine kinase [Candidatus Limnocylindrales bacterium]|nr:HAMP domain-containing sensor histidine kinase [Candidatus Limnocylindrales bacterium]